MLALAFGSHYLGGDATVREGEDGGGVLEKFTVSSGPPMYVQLPGPVVACLNRLRAAVSKDFCAASQVLSWMPTPPNDDDQHNNNKRSSSSAHGVTARGIRVGAAARCREALDKLLEALQASEEKAMKADAMANEGGPASSASAAKSDPRGKKGTARSRMRQVGLFPSTLEDEFESSSSESDDDDEGSDDSDTNGAQGRATAAAAKKAAADAVRPSGAPKPKKQALEDFELLRPLLPSVAFADPSGRAVVDLLVGSRACGSWERLFSLGGLGLEDLGDPSLEDDYLSCPNEATVPKPDPNPDPNPNSTLNPDPDPHPHPNSDPRRPYPPARAAVRTLGSFTHVSMDGIDGAEGLRDPVLGKLRRDSNRDSAGGLNPDGSGGLNLIVPVVTPAWPRHILRPERVPCGTRDSPPTDPVASTTGSKGQEGNRQQPSVTAAAPLQPLSLSLSDGLSGLQAGYLHRQVGATS